MTPRRSFGAAAVRERTRVRWESAGMGFELETLDPSVSETARSVFARWRCGAAPLAATTRSWQVDLLPDGAWSVIDAATGQEVSRSRAAETAVAHVESLCINALVTEPAVAPSLHAAVVVRPDGAAIACVGRCGSGKSTLALSLWHGAGWELACDDVALLDSEPGRVEPVPRRVSVRTTSRPLLGEAC